MIRSTLSNFGFDPVKTINALRALPDYLIELNLFKKAGCKDFKNITLYPCLSDRYDTSGTGKGHYFHQDLLVAQKIFKTQPRRHVDIGSRIDGFVAHVAAFREIEVFDIRTNQLHINNIIFRQLDFMLPLPSEFHGYSDSVSCLHAIEHFGLGRYGDHIDPEGFHRGLENISRLCTIGATVYLGVPIGAQRVEFNAHRVFSTSFLLELLEKQYKIASFSYIDDLGNLYENVDLNRDEINNNYHCTFGCAIFELIKKEI